MTNRYCDLIDQTFYFPQEGFEVENGNLIFNGVPMMYLIEKYGTPLKLTYLPRIGTQIKKARNWFSEAIRQSGYTGKYHYCYCTKSNHFSYTMEEVLRHQAHLETSSNFDINLVLRLWEKGKLNKHTILVHNGYKPPSYLNAIAKLRKLGFTGSIPILDNKAELQFYGDQLDGPVDIGIRVATQEEPNFEFYTSRLGIRREEVLSFYQERILNNHKFRLKMLHFFVNTGIKDSLYYWGELRKVLKLYGELKQICPELTGLNIGGGMPIRNSLDFEYDYKYMIVEIIKNIQQTCLEYGIPEPDIFTEFGKFTVGESGATIFTVLGSKRQNDTETWYMVDNSLMNTIPDAWGLGERFILLPINKWEKEYQRVNIGGLSCDNSDFYNAEINEPQGILPVIDQGEAVPLYIGFFHTGAYQDAISGTGGIKHCLIPTPKHILIQKDQQGNHVDQLWQPEQSPEEVLKILGY